MYQILLTRFHFFLCIFFYCRSVVVDIGGCTLKYFSLGDSMAPGHEVCTFVINCMCRKFFLDERPTISLKHYFFSSVSVSDLYYFVLLFFLAKLRLSRNNAIYMTYVDCIHE